MSFVSINAYSTVDSYLNYTYIQESIQFQGYCYNQATMQAELGSPLPAMMAGMFNDVSILSYTIGFPLRYENNNVLATQPRINWTFNGEELGEDGVFTFRTVIDMTALANANGYHYQGRLDTITKAKLALLALAKNASAISQDNFRLWVTFWGLPDQSDLPGLKLYWETRWPYNFHSQFIQSFQDDLISEYCI